MLNNSLSEIESNLNNICKITNDILKLDETSPKGVLTKELKLKLVKIGILAKKSHIIIVDKKIESLSQPLTFVQDEGGYKPSIRAKFLD